MMINTNKLEDQLKKFALHQKNLNSIIQSLSTKLESEQVKTQFPKRLIEQHQESVIQCQNILLVYVETYKDLIGKIQKDNHVEKNLDKNTYVFDSLSNSFKTLIESIIKRQLTLISQEISLIEKNKANSVTPVDFDKMIKKIKVAQEQDKKSESDIDPESTLLMGYLSSLASPSFEKSTLAMLNQEESELLFRFQGLVKKSSESPPLSQSPNADEPIVLSLDADGFNFKATDQGASKNK